MNDAAAVQARTARRSERGQSVKEPPEGLTAPGRLLFVYLPDRLDDQSESGRLNAELSRDPDRVP